MKKVARERMPKQGVVRPETPRERREREALHEDVSEGPFVGRPIEHRLRNFKPSADSYLAALGGPLPYMTRLRAIHVETLEHLRQLAEARRELFDEVGGDERAFAARWLELADLWSFDEVNDLIERHNRWYPVESRLPMDPKTGDYALVNGEPYRRPLLDADWILERFPSTLAESAAA